MGLGWRGCPVRGRRVSWVDIQHPGSFGSTLTSAPSLSSFLASDRRDYTVENLIRMGVAALILVVLGILLLEAQHSQTRTPDAARS